MIDGLIGGKLYGAATQKTAKNGNPFVTAKVRVSTGEETVFANVIAFDASACRSLMALGDGEAVSLSGSIKLGAWTDREGHPKPSMDVVAAHVLTTYHVAKKRKAVAGDEPRDRHDDDSWPSH